MFWIFEMIYCFLEWDTLWKWASVGEQEVNHFLVIYSYMCTRRCMHTYIYFYINEVLLCMLFDILLFSLGSVLWTCFHVHSHYHFHGCHSCSFMAIHSSFLSCFSLDQHLDCYQKLLNENTAAMIMLEHMLLCIFFLAIILGDIPLRSVEPKNI